MPWCCCYCRSLFWVSGNILRLQTSNFTFIRHLMQPPTPPSPSSIVNEWENFCMNESVISFSQWREMKLESDRKNSTGNCETIIFYSIWALLTKSQHLNIKSLVYDWIIIVMKILFFSLHSIQISFHIKFTKRVCKS